MYPGLASLGISASAFSRGGMRLGLLHVSIVYVHMHVCMCEGAGRRSTLGIVPQVLNL